MKNIFLYPYTPRMDSIIKMRNLLENYKIKCVGCYKEDRAYLQRHYRDLCICSEFSEGINEADAVFINPEVLDKENVEDYIKYTETKKIPQIEIKEKYTPLEDVRGYSLKKIECPILAVMGQGEECSKFETMGILVSHLRKRGYCVLGITGNAYAPILEVEKIPSYFYNENVDFTHKTANFNRYIAGLVEENCPDLIVIDIPGGIFPVMDIEYYHFSEFSLMISLAVEIDAAFVNLFYNNLDFDRETLLRFTKSTKEHCLQKYKAPVIQFCITSQYLRPNRESKKTQILTLRDEETEKAFKKFSEGQVVSLENRKAIIDKLEEIIAEMEEEIELV